MSVSEDILLFEQLVNNANDLFLSEEDFVTINGVTKPTLKKIYAEFLASTGTFPTVDEGLKETNGTGTRNRFFTVPASGSTYEVRYRNDAGSAISIGRVPSVSAVETIEEDLKVIADRSSERFYKGRKVYSGEVDLEGNASIVTFEDGSVLIPKLELSEYALNAVQGVVSESVNEGIKAIADSSQTFYFQGREVYKATVDLENRASFVTLADGAVVIPKLELSEPALAVVQEMIDNSSSTPVGPSVEWPTTALDALALAARRRVDFVMLGDSNQAMDGYGWGGGLMRALHNRFGCYATAVSTQTPVTLSGYTNTGEMTRGIRDTSYNEAPAEVESVFPGFSFPIATGRGGIGYAWVPDGGAISSSSARGGGVSLAADHAIGVSNKLRIHYDWVSVKEGSGSFQVAARIAAAPWTHIVRGELTSTNTGEYSLHKQTLDIPAGARTAGIECNWFIPAGAPVTGPFAAAWFRVENPEKASGISVSTFYSAGGQSLYDMAAYITAAPDQVLINWFGETRRLQLLTEEKPIVVVYVNSGLNDQNETLQPSLGWRESDSPKSSTAYIDNLEAIVKRVCDIWQKAGWGETEIFFLVMPSHPIATPDASKLLAYRKAAKSFAGAQRVSFVDLENVTSNSEMLAKNWYKENNNDIYHLVKEAYQTLGTRVVALIPEVE